MSICFDEKYSGTDIKNNKGYTPEPDIFHDIQAHVPFLMNKDYAKFMWEIGILGDEIIKDHRNLGPDLVTHNLKRLQNFAWWTYEYGLIKNMGDSDHLRRLPNDIDFEIYGAGIISSVDVVDIVAVDREPEKVYQPGHPKADKDGYIYMAAVNTEEEMVEMLEASRQYENNVEVVSTLRGLMMRTISMGK